MTSLAQTTDELEIKKTINQLFEGMRTNDSSIVRSVFYDQNYMFTILKRNDEVKVVSGNMAEFVQAFGSKKNTMWDERISQLTIESDGLLASAWMTYSFYVDETFSHCGVNHMQLINIKNEWKILVITDTRRKTNCQ